MSKDTALEIQSLRARIEQLEDDVDVLGAFYKDVRKMVRFMAAVADDEMNMIRILKEGGGTSLGPSALRMMNGEALSGTPPEIAKMAHFIGAFTKTIAAAANAERRLQSDPKQLAKREASQLWRERYAGKHPKLRTNEQFAAECMRRWPELTSAKVILGWCTEWNKRAKRGTHQAS